MQVGVEADLPDRPLARLWFALETDDWLVHKARIRIRARLAGGRGSGVVAVG